MFDRREIEFRRKDRAQRAKAMRMSLDIDVHLRTGPSLGLDRASRAWHIEDMCNLYSMPRNQAAIRNQFEVLMEGIGNLPSMPGISGLSCPNRAYR